MADHYDGFFVVLDRDLSSEESQPTIEAIRQIKGVISVEPHVGRQLDGLSTRKRLVNDVHAGMLELIERLRVEK